jgi:TolB-like protein/Tfp pilus assembly protein PilF
MNDDAARLRAALYGLFRLERVLGRGGMATVWLAHDLKLDRPVALKVLRPDIASALTSARFIREIRVTGNLSHPHIVPLFDSGEEQGFLYYVMPYVPGETLRQRLDREKQLPIGDALRITGEVAYALDYAHRQGIVHRDIKPENIMLSEGHALVADFGVSRAIAVADPTDKLTESGLAIGTLHYMSPEQAEGRREVDGRADVYALGCVLYEMLAGVPPFQGATAESLLRQHLMETPRPVTTFRAGVDRRIERAVAGALAKAPADRWQSGEEFVAALHRRPGSPGPVMLVAGAALAIIVTAVLVVAGRGLPTVGVLYFDNLSDDSADVYLTDGLTEEIIARLGQIERLTIASRTASWRYRGKTAAGPAALGHALNVTNLVSGSVRRSSHRVRVDVELMRVNSGARLWGAEFDRPDTDLLDVEANIATAVAGAVAGHLAPPEQLQLRTPATRDPVAYDHYLRGNHYLAQRTARAVGVAIAEYDSAAARDSRFVEALARQAYGYTLFLYYGWPYDTASATTLLAWGQRCANQALQADSNAAEAWLAQGRILEIAHPITYEGAIAAYRRASALDSRDPEIFNILGGTLRELGDDAGAVQAFHHALELDPDRATTLTLLGIQASVAGNYHEALRWADSALTVDPGFYDAYISRGFYRLFQGDTAGAHADAQVASQLPAGNHLADETLLVLLAAQEGDTRAARRRMTGVVKQFDTAHPSPLVGTLLARAWVGLSDRERALDVLQRVTPRGAALWYWLRSAGFDPIRSDPRFRQIVTQSRLPAAP